MPDHRKTHPGEGGGNALAARFSARFVY